MVFGTGYAKSVIAIKMYFRGGENPGQKEINKSVRNGTEEIL